jgi:hypothetical protein
MKSRYKIAAMPFVIGLMASPLLANCSAVNGALGAAGVESPDCSDELKSGNFANVKADAGVKGFLDASSKFKGAVDKMEADLIASCRELGKGAGMSDDELKGEPDNGKGSDKVCGAVGAKISGIIKAHADAGLTVEVTPPSCGADIDAMQNCFQECGSPIKPGELKASCEGGEISGQCDADCQGSCTVEAGAECKGSCSGSCEGSCDASFSGTCGGKCDGKCDGKDNHGKCAGHCEGKCDAQAKGSCSGTCSGKCDASCEVKGQAKCSGECHGGCSAEFKAPKCSGEFKPPSVSIDCQAKCAAKGAASLKCEPPGVRVVTHGKVDVEVEKLASALRVSLPKIVKAEMGDGKMLAKAGAKLVTQIKAAASGVANAGIHTAGCMTMAVEQTVSAAASIDVNVQASVKLRGSANANASAGGSAGAKTVY